MIATMQPPADRMKKALAVLQRQGAGQTALVGDPPQTASGLPSVVPPSSGGTMFRRNRMPSGTPPIAPTQDERTAQGFDYTDLESRMAELEEKPSTWDRLRPALAAGLMHLGGNQQGANAFLANQSRMAADKTAELRDLAKRLADYKYRDYARTEDARMDYMRPRTVGRDVVSVDPLSGDSRTLYQGEQDFEIYAARMGYEPGSDEYYDAQEDFVLRGSGPTAHGRDLELDDYRTANDVELEGVRHSNRTELQDRRHSQAMARRSSPTYRDVNGPPPRRSANSQPVATNPQTGERLKWNGTDWVPVR